MAPFNTMLTLSVLCSLGERGVWQPPFATNYLSENTEPHDRMHIFMLILLLNTATLLITLATASRVPSWSVSCPVGIALLAWLAAGE